jgi:Rha family phage regulatory protein
MTADDMPSAEGDSNPIVFVENGHVRATSRDVAAYFGKHHGHVMRTIHSLLKAEAGLSQSTFGLADYVDDQGKRRPAYSMDRDGFTLVAMGFTGPNALRFKWAYIQAFNSMEAKLHGTQPDHREFPDWPVDEMRAKTAVVEMYRRACGPLSAQWAMPRVGFPVPPLNMIEIGRQLLLDLIGGGPKPEEESKKAA